MPLQSPVLRNWAILHNLRFRSTPHYSYLNFFGFVRKLTSVKRAISSIRHTPSFFRNQGEGARVVDNYFYKQSYSSIKVENSEL